MISKTKNMINCAITIAAFWTSLYFIMDHFLNMFKIACVRANAPFQTGTMQPSFQCLKNHANTMVFLQKTNDFLVLESVMTIMLSINSLSEPLGIVDISTVVSQAT